MIWWAVMVPAWERHKPVIWVQLGWQWKRETEETQRVCYKDTETTMFERLSQICIIKRYKRTHREKQLQFDEIKTDSCAIERDK